MKGWTVCRFHGARGGAPKGKANGAYRHGLYTAEAIEERRALRKLLRESRELLECFHARAIHEHRDLDRTEGWRLAGGEWVAPFR